MHNPFRLINFLFHLPVWPLCFWGYHRNKTVVDADLQRLNREGFSDIVLALLDNKPFRNLFYYRVGRIGKFIGILLREQSSLHIFSDTLIGKGLVIVHGDSTFINPKSMGENCYVNQNVTIGVIGTERPVIGDNVRVATGAIILGGITIGDNCTIAAGAVVVRDVPSNCMVAGNPAVIKKMNGEKVNIPLSAAL